MSTLHTAERTNPEQGDSRVPEELASLIKRHRIRPLERDGRTLLSVDAEWFWSDPNSTTLNQRGSDCMENAPVDTPVEQLGKFVVIKDGRVLFEAEKLMEAIKECVHRTGGAVYGRLANIPIEEGATE